MARVTGSHLICEALKLEGVRNIFALAGDHILPVLDVMADQDFRIIDTRHEQAAVHMADAYARVTGGLGVGITSTGVAAGNAAGSLVEALVAGTPVLHLTGQVELPYLDRNRYYIHEAPRQPDMLKAVSKAFFRIWSPDEARMRRRAMKRLTTSRCRCFETIPNRLSRGSAAIVRFSRTDNSGKMPSALRSSERYAMPSAIASAAAAMCTPASSWFTIFTVLPGPARAPSR